MRLTAATTLGLLALAALPSGSRAQVQTITTRTFGVGVQGRSVWGSGPATFEESLTRSRSWDVHRAFDLELDAVNFGLKGSVHSTGTAGFTARLGVSGGTLSTSLTATHTLVRTAPASDVVAREAVQLKSAWANPTLTLATTTLSADASLRLFGAATFGLHGEACYVVDCETGGFDGVLPGVNQELVGYNTATNQVRVAGHATSVKAFPYGQDISVPEVPGTSVTIYQPDLSLASVGTKRVLGSVTTPLLAVGVDPIAAMAQMALGDIPCITGCFIAVGDERVGFKQFVSAFEPLLSLRQDIEVLARPFTAFDFNQAVRYRQGTEPWKAATTHVELAGWDASFEFEVPAAAAGVQDLVVTSTLGVSARVTNRTYLVLDPNWRVSVMEVDLPGSSADFGPLYETILDPARPLAVELFDGSYDLSLGQVAGATSSMRYAQGRPALSGFGPPSAPGVEDGGDDDAPPPPPDDLEIVAPDATTATPEPATVALLAAGVAALAVATRRRRR